MWQLSLTDIQKNYQKGKKKAFFAFVSFFHVDSQHLVKVYFLSLCLPRMLLPRPGSPGIDTVVQRQSWLSTPHNVPLSLLFWAPLNSSPPSSSHVDQGQGGPHAAIPLTSTRGRTIPACVLSENQRLIPSVLNLSHPLPTPPSGLKSQSCFPGFLRETHLCKPSYVI